MKIKVKNSLLESVIKQEARKLKNELSESKKNGKLRQISEQRQKIKAQLKEMYEEQELDELFGMGKFAKAKKAFKAANEQAIADMMNAYKNKDMSYIDKSRALLDVVNQSLSELAQQFGITDRSDLLTLRTSLLELVQPMDYKTFAAQAKRGGFSIKDIGSGAGVSSSGK